MFALTSRLHVPLHPLLGLPFVLCTAYELSHHHQTAARINFARWIARDASFANGVGSMPHLSFQSTCMSPCKTLFFDVPRYHRWRKGDSVMITGRHYFLPEPAGTCLLVEKKKKRKEKKKRKKKTALSRARIEIAWLTQSCSSQNKSKSDFIAAWQFTRLTGPRSRSRASSLA